MKVCAFKNPIPITLDKSITTINSHIRFITIRTIFRTIPLVSWLRRGRIPLVRTSAVAVVVAGSDSVLCRLSLDGVVGSGKHNAVSGQTPHHCLTLTHSHRTVETQTRSGSFNWDLLSQTSPESILEAINSRRPVFSEAYNLPDPNDADAMAEYEAWTEWFSNYVRPGEDPSAPANDLHWPVIDRPLNAVLAPAATWTSDNATNVSNETIPDTVLEPPRVVAQLVRLCLCVLADLLRFVGYSVE